MNGAGEAAGCGWLRSVGGKWPAGNRKREGAEDWCLLDLSNLLGGSEDTSSLKKGGEQMPQAGGRVVCLQHQTELQVIALRTGGTGEEKLSQTQAPHFREAESTPPCGDAGALHSTTAERGQQPLPKEA